MEESLSTHFHKISWSFIFNSVLILNLLQSPIQMLCSQPSESELPIQTTIVFQLICYLTLYITWNLSFMLSEVLIYFVIFSLLHTIHLVIRSQFIFWVIRTIVPSIDSAFWNFPSMKYSGSSRSINFSCTINLAHSSFPKMQCYCLVYLLNTIEFSTYSLSQRYWSARSREAV